MPPQRNRTGRVILPAKKRQEPFLGKYSSEVTKRVPSRFSRLKHPLELYKDVPEVKEIFKEYLTGPVFTPDILPKFNWKWNKSLKSIFEDTLVDFKKQFKERFRKEPFKTGGSETHIFLPVSGMSTIGQFYKGLFEQVMPRARITFLVTPKEAGRDPNFKVDEFLTNHIKKSLNKNDKHFVIFDFMGGITKIKVFLEIQRLTTNIKEKEELYKKREAYQRTYGGFFKDPDFEKSRDYAIKYLEAKISAIDRKFDNRCLFIDTKYEPRHNRRNYAKLLDFSNGIKAISKAMPISEARKNPNVSYSDYDSTYIIDKNRNPISKEEYIKLKRLERAREYTYYWLGKEFASNPKNKAFFE